MTMTPEQLVENFKTQQAQVMEDIRKLDAELTQKKELYIKLQGALEGLELLTGEKTEDAPTETVDPVEVAMS